MAAITFGACLKNCDRSLPTSCVPDACSHIPGSRHDLIERLLNPNRIVIVEVYDCAKRFTVIEVILNMGIPGEAADAHLNPRVPGKARKAF